MRNLYLIFSLELKRDSVVQNFRLGKIWVMIATDLMGRGLDFKACASSAHMPFLTMLLGR